MAVAPETAIMALYCDFENVALGVRDAKYDKFDIKPVLERLLLKGSIVVKKAYCDWERYKGFKSTMHEASFELIEIPHLRQSGKNSADIRLVVDALDLCYTKSHVDTFVIISGDSDFSPLVSKLRENAKYVIGVGVKQSTSDLLIGNCDEFIFYDDLVRESQRAARRDSREAQAMVKRTPEEDAQRRAELEERRRTAIGLAVATFEALVAERGDGIKIWASMLKEAIKRRKPDFSESYYGFRAFGNLLEEAQARGLLELGRDEKSGTFVSRSNGIVAGRVPSPAVAAEAVSGESAEEVVVPVPTAGAREPGDESAAANRKRPDRSKASGKRSGRTATAKSAPDTAPETAPETQQAAENPVAGEGDTANSAPLPAAESTPASGRSRSRRRSTPAVNTGVTGEAPDPVPEPTIAATGIPLADSNGGTDETSAPEPARKAVSRGRRPRKPKEAVDNA